jgi:hypothetical protein
MQFSCNSIKVISQLLVYYWHIVPSLTSGGRGVASSNLAIPTEKKRLAYIVVLTFFYYQKFFLY